MNDFGRNFKELRLRKGLTQDQIASLLGVSKSRISMYETGNRRPSFEMLELISDFFNVDMNILLGSDSSVFSSSDQVDSLFIEKYGRQVFDAAMTFASLDDVDRGRICERMSMLLEDDKYKKGLSEEKVI